MLLLLAADWLIEVNLIDDFFAYIYRQVTGVMTQGRGDGNEWVTSFMVTYSLDAFHWQYASDLYGNQRVSMNA